MKGDFTRFTYDPRKHYTRVLKQQGRVDLDADWNEAVEILTRRDRTEATDVIGRCGAPIHDGGFRVEATPDGSGLTLSPGRLWVDGILCGLEGPDPVPLTDQEDLPGYELPDEDGVYLVYVDVWDRHVTHLEDPDIREGALGGPDTATRTRTVCQVRLHRIAADESLDLHECAPYPADPSTGSLSANAEAADDPTNPCAVPAAAGYTGLENRLYRVEIHDDGRDADGVPGARPVTFKWSRDNGSVVLPVADENGIDGDTVSLDRLGFDDVLTVRQDDWVEILGDETELHGRRGTLAQIVPDGIDRTDLEVELDRDVSAHDGEGHLKMRRWDHHETDDVALIDGALPLPAGPFELEDGVVIELDPAGDYHTGDYWVIPARTREGIVLWPREGDPPAPVALPPLGIHHHYCTLALARRSGGAWAGPRDCRPLFPPLTEVDEGGCCLRVEPGEDVQQALDAVVAAGGGCVALCEGVHRVGGPIWIRDGSDVKIHGEGPATVVRFEEAGEAGVGGLLVERGRRISVEDLVMVSDRVPALVTLLHGPDGGLNRRIALRRLDLVNLTPTDGETDLPCGVRLGHADGVTLDECRIAAAVGVLSLWGDALPVPGSGQGTVTPGPEGEPGAPGGPAAIVVDFEELDLGTELNVGDGFQQGGATVTGEPFQWSNGQSTEDGFARVENGRVAGGTGQEVQVNNINLAFALPTAYATVRLRFAELGGNVNLRINGDARNVLDFSELDGEVIGGVGFGVTLDPDDPERGLLFLDAETRDVEAMAIGGQELWIDGVTFRGPSDVPVPPPPPDSYGDGVRDLRMRDSAVRFGDAGVLAARAEGWQVDRTDLGPYGDEAWAEAARRYVEADEPSEPGGPSGGRSDRVGHRRVLGALEPVFAEAAAPRGYGLLAFRWERCAVRDSTVTAAQGLHAWWWVGGSADGNRVVAEESGCHGFWLHDVAWDGNDVRTADGVALSLGGCCRAAFEHNRLRGPVGIANLSIPDALQGFVALATGLLRGYGGAGATERAVVRGILVDESLRLMGLGPLLDALQPMVDEESPTPGVPAAYYLAPRLLEALQGAPFLPIIDLAVRHDDVAADSRGIGLDGFVPLGSIRVEANRVHTTTGQAVGVRTNPFLANAHLTVSLLRAVLRRLAEFIEESRDGVDGELAGLLDVFVDLLEDWSEGVENLLDLDFRIEGNTVRSLRNAIETNLFEASVLTNHVTLQERPLRATPTEATGTVFGQVLTTAGAPVPQARVRAMGTTQVAFTDASGAYSMPGMEEGTYTLRASAVQYGVAATEVSVEGGEQVEVDFTLNSGFQETHLVRGGFSDATVGASAGFTNASNAEIVEIMRALERSEALEPLAVLLREGARTLPDAYAGTLLASSGPLATEAARNEAADAAVVVQGRASDAELRVAAGELNAALRANDQEGARPILVRFIRGLQRYIDSQGILVEGLGARIVENQVVVPADAEEATESLGGIQVSVSAAQVLILSILATLVQRMLGGGTNDEQPAADHLLGVTETLVDTNEVVGGIGHGISVQGVAGLPDFVPDLRIRGNQVRGVAGSGILIGEHALVVGLEMADNHVTACGRPRGFTRQKGGLFVRTAAVCGLRDNHVLRCGAGLFEDDLYGVDLDTLYGLHFVGNQVQGNGTAAATTEDGGVRLAEVYGATLVHDNVFAFNRGFGLSWANFAEEGEAGLLPPFLMDAVRSYLRMDRTVDQLVEEEQASLQGNTFKSVAETDLPVFQITNLREVLFSGNTCHAETTGGPLGVIQLVTRGVISHNQTHAGGNVAILILWLSGGAVLGNVGNRPIQIVASGPVEQAFNVPPAV